MLDRLFPSHLADLQQGLDRAAKRQGLLMDNLANVNVPGYKRRDMDFNITLKEEMGAGDLAKPFGFAGAADGSWQDEGSIRPDGNSVNPEQEALGIAQTELRFSTISDMTQGYFSGLKSAIREGK